MRTRTEIPGSRAGQTTGCSPQGQQRPLSLCIPPLFPQLHLQAQLHPPGAVGYWVREFRWKHPTDHSSQQTPVPGAPERTKGRHVSPQQERKRVSAKARLCANHGWGWGWGRVRWADTPSCNAKGAQQGAAGISRQGNVRLHTAGHTAQDSFLGLAGSRACASGGLILP